MNNKDVATLARVTRDKLAARGYKPVTLKDLRLHVECIMNAIHEFGQNEDERRAYDPIHATRYYSDNGAAYCAAQTFIFDWAPVAIAHRAAAANRRALMIERGTWTEAHELFYHANF